MPAGVVSHCYLFKSPTHTWPYTWYPERSFKLSPTGKEHNFWEPAASRCALHIWAILASWARSLVVVTKWDTCMIMKLFVNCCLDGAIFVQFVKLIRTAPVGTTLIQGLPFTLFLPKTYNGSYLPRKASHSFSISNQLTNKLETCQLASFVTLTTFPIQPLLCSN